MLPLIGSIGWPGRSLLFCDLGFLSSSGGAATQMRLVSRPPSSLSEVAVLMRVVVWLV